MEPTGNESQEIADVPAPERRTGRYLLMGAIVLLPLVGFCGGVVGLVGWGLSRTATERGGNTETPRPERLTGEPIQVVLTEDQRIAWQKVRKNNLTMPTRIAGCLPRSQGRQSFDDEMDTEDRWHFAHPYRIFFDGPRTGEAAPWAQREDLGKAYFAPTFTMKFEDTDSFQKLREEQAQREENITRNQRERDALNRPRSEEERRFFERQFGQTIEEYEKKVNEEELAKSRQDNKERLVRNEEAFERCKIAVALKHAKMLCSRNEVKATVAIDLFSGDEPRVLRWFWNDGKETKSSDKPPNRERQKSLERFLGSLMRHAGDL